MLPGLPRVRKERNRPSDYLRAAQGVDRLLFGSDYPLDDPRSAAAAIAGMGFERSELSKVFFENAVSLFGLERAGH